MRFPEVQFSPEDRIITLKTIAIGDAVDSRGGRALWRAVRHMPDRLLHPLRRARASARLRRRGVTSSVLVVCHGNICRSPYAAAALKKALRLPAASAVRIESAGFLAPGRYSPEEAIRAAGSHGVDLKRHRSRSITRESVVHASLVVTMDTRQRSMIRDRFGKRARDVIVLGDLDPVSIRTRAVADPIEGVQEIFEQCYDRIDRCIEALADALAHTVHRADGARRGAG